MRIVLKRLYYEALSIYSSKATYKFFIRKKKLKTFEELENECNPILLHTYW